MPEASGSCAEARACERSGSALVPGLSGLDEPSARVAAVGFCAWLTLVNRGRTANEDHVSGHALPVRAGERPDVLGSDRRGDSQRRRVRRVNEEMGSSGGTSFGKESKDQAHGSADVAVAAVVRMRAVRDVRVSGWHVCGVKVRLDHRHVAVIGRVDGEVPHCALPERISPSCEHALGVRSSRLGCQCEPGLAMATEPRPPNLFFVYAAQLDVDVDGLWSPERHNAVGKVPCVFADAVHQLGHFLKVAVSGLSAAQPETVRGRLQPALDPGDNLVQLLEILAIATRIEVGHVPGDRIQVVTEGPNVCECP